jgi:hypothetical protein
MRLGLILLASLGAAGVYALLTGTQRPKALSDGLFFVGTLLMLVALMPLASQMVNRVRFAAQWDDQDAEEILEKARERGRQDDRIIILFGIGGVIVMALSIVIGFSVK